ncbi:hypothetical protein Dpo_13c01160 [Desulfotignum phosphitoxidans DSM 13687]|jgi:predicted nucleic acid-binding protein|uniref:PIN domain-containing protein n=1 Tax=Desulfotignum phosphitoxidans DSM 13687 TaxID=1286635 RepID=S0FRN4_9BACT|nr:hypothetical protein Dpo_13c01160 [Desulfotignum phosphitoxidans DSM 13687]
MKYLIDTNILIYYFNGSLSVSHNLKLVTHNVKDFIGINLAISDPF